MPFLQGRCFSYLSLISGVHNLSIYPSMSVSHVNLRAHCFCRGAGYTFGSGVVHKFLETNNMSHILRAHQLCMEGFSSLFDKHLSTVWSAPNYCYRCGNSASILEVGPGESMYFNVFEAAPENERDGPSHQAPQNAGGKVCRYFCRCLPACPLIGTTSFRSTSSNAAFHLR